MHTDFTWARRAVVWSAVSLELATGVWAQGEWKAPSEAKALSNPVREPGNARNLVEANCLPCHGEHGRGDGPAAVALPPPKPADWTSERVQQQTDGELFWKITNGRGVMPAWKHLPERERWELINYIRSLNPRGAALPQPR
jgi:mono/diheme cytochrome c family protein